MNKAYKVLEYNKILDRLANYTGSEYIKNRIFSLEPTKNLQEAIRLQQETSEAVTMLLSFGSPANLTVANVLGSIKRCEMSGVLSMAELLGIAKLLRVTKSMKTYLSETKKHIPILSDLAEGLVPIKTLETEISLAILDEDEVADTASTNLHQIRRKLGTLNAKIKETLNEMIHSTHWRKFLQDPIVTMRSDRYVLPVRAEYRGEVKGIVHDSSSSGATLFIEPMTVVNANNEIRELLVKEKDEIEIILAQLSEKVAEHTTELESNFNIVSELDFIFAKAKLSIDMDAREPELNDEGIIYLKKARHPLIDKKVVVASDIYLGNEFDTLVITGPNTGGKTVTLKTIGLFSLMAATGLHLPCAETSKAAVFNNVFADIGDEQSIEQSLSTFSSHMTNIVNILKNVDYNSLALFDELGAGTDPTEGAALAMSILEKLQIVGTKVVATTHYSELKLFALSTHRVENASCEFDVESLRPTYKLLIGVPGKSNAFSISKRLGLKDDIIERASNLLTDENVKFEDIVSELENNKVIAEREKQYAQRHAKELDELKKQVEEQKQLLEDSKQKMLDEARREAKLIVLDAKEQSQKIIKDLQQMRADVDVAKMNEKINETRTKLREKEETVDDAINEAAKEKMRFVGVPKNLKLGNNVKILNLDQEASVITLPDKNGNLFVQAGIMKIKVHISNLRLIEDMQNKKTTEKYVKSRTGDVAFKSSMVKREIDLRGQTLDEAVVASEKFIDDAYMAGLEQISIIHGKGTGVLRSGIQDMLKKNKNVKSYRLGRYGEGETGVTIVEINK